MNRPTAEEHPPYFKKYIDTVSDNVAGELEYQITSFTRFLKTISEEKSCFAYAEGKWTIKELVGHMIDTERIMAYRILRFSRNDQTPLSGFDENEFVAHAHFNDRTLNSLAEEFALVREANMFLIKSLNETELNRTGSASGNSISVKALIYILAGHVNHHRAIIEERYV